MTRIVVDIMPLLTMVIVLFVAFWSSIYLLIQVELTSEDNPEWHNLESSIFILWNMGLYTDIDKKLVNYQRGLFAIILYQLYMFVTQVVLLNMLIAIMAESNEAVRSVSQLVAKFERAQLLVKWERRLASEDDRRDSDLLGQVGGKRSWSRQRIQSLMRFLSCLPSGKERTMQTIFPRWLHVLVPPEQRSRLGVGGAGVNEGEMDVSLQLTQLTRTVKALSDESTRSAQSLGDVIERNRAEMLRHLIEAKGAGAKGTEHMAKGSSQLRAAVAKAGTNGITKGEAPAAYGAVGGAGGGASGAAGGAAGGGGGGGG
eukprot:CAMPEP_0174705756 /NCGR_PEP_ID=MMETSP1094-20130205/8866_1 /TAXON_ID=156173 /ORGANISM="Chrysochromulina brevifilum, Strain UTEX LB 985" /LENGTH=313 /DNA_ID=CAMNT_0015903957 /DNA_START=66 /DNA_END=1004 /DNA_ORIENTATION=-